MSTVVPAPMSAAVITVSDRVANGQAENRSGPAVVAALVEQGFDVAATVVVADGVEGVAAAILTATETAALVLTTGGTGLGPRDRTPEATASVADYLVPGIAEEIRRAGRESTPLAVLSRGLAAVVGGSLVVNLPGSPSGAVESLGAVATVLPHALAVLRGADHPHQGGGAA